MRNVPVQQFKIKNDCTPLDRWISKTYIYMFLNTAALNVVLETFRDISQLYMIVTVTYLLSTKTSSDNGTVLHTTVFSVLANIKHFQLQRWTRGGYCKADEKDKLCMMRPKTVCSLGLYESMRYDINPLLVPWWALQIRTIVNKNLTLPRFIFCQWTTHIHTGRGGTQPKIQRPHRWPIPKHPTTQLHSN